MPCNSDYMIPTAKERGFQETAQLLIYVRQNTKSGVKISDKLRAAASNSYCTKDYVSELCAAIKNLTPEEMDRIVYDGRNPTARKLADWWDRHEAADKARLQKEATEQEQKRLVKLALKKLTASEISALNIPEDILEKYNG